MKTYMKALATGLIIVISIVGLSGCGKKSALTPPPDSEYPKQYPRQ